MTNLRKAAQQALGILCSEFTTVDGEFCRWCDGRLNAKHNCALEQTITALRAALAQQDEPVQEPVAALIAQRDALLEALRALVRNEGLDAYVYLDKGIGTETAAGQRWLNARAAVAAVEENPHT